MNADCALIVFAKAPVPGQAKTRLAATLGAERAARLAARMLEATLDAAADAAVGPIELCCTPDATHPAFVRAVRAHGVSLAQQGDGDLGVRMCRAFSRALKRHPRALLIGTDIPRLDAALLREAAHALHTHAAVFAPVTDGGYGLVGLSQPLPALFEGIAWSTDSVMAQSRKCLLRLHIAAYELAPLDDVDVPDDLALIPPEWLI